VRTRLRPFPDLVLFGVLAALLVTRVVALAWSPDARAGFQPVVVLGQFMVVLVVMSCALREDPALLRYVQRLYWPAVAAQALLVLVFRFLPGVEDAYLTSIGGFFAGHNTVGVLFTDGRNNVLDPVKAGGVFINANVAAMFLGVNGLAALAAWVLTRTRWVGVIGLCALAAVPFTGSKSASVLAFTLPVLAVGGYQLSRPDLPAKRRYLLLGGVAAGAATIVGALLAHAGLRHAMFEAFVGRTVIWGFGAQSFRETPILGLGYGGWDEGFGPYAAAEGLNRSFPPHNVLLAAWSSTGLVGLLLSVAFFAIAFWLVFRGLSGRFAVDRRFAALTGAAIAWMVVQGMGENTDIFGDIHLIPVLALLIVHLITPTGEESGGHASHTDSRHNPAPAVQTVGDLHPEPGAGASSVPAPVRGEGPGIYHTRNHRG
jgi:hypothetical protein